MWQQLWMGDANGLDLFIVASMLFLGAAFLFIILGYAKGLWACPRELYLILFTKIVEFSAYAAALLAFVLYLHHDVGLSDVAAGSYIGTWSVAVAGVTLLVGAVCDAIGIKRTLLIGCFALLFARFFLPLLNDLALVTVLGFIPLAFGIAITGPVLLVGVKRYTTAAGATLAFGLLYTMINLGWAIGGWIFDFVRGTYGDFSVVTTLPLVGELSVYQLIFAVGFAFTVPNLIAVSLMRANVEMTEGGIRFDAEGPSRARSSVAAIGTQMTSALRDTIAILRSVVRERRFWIFLSLLGILVFVRLIHYHFIFTFPTYGIRLFGEGAKVGNLYAVLNPLMIVFLTPLFAVMTARVSSYKMLICGSGISVLSIGIATLPPELFAPLVNTGFGELVYSRWLDVPEGQWDPFYLVLVIFISVYSVGEAFWGARVLQFTAELAPLGREGSYIALSYLPFFVAQIFVGPMSGLLLATYMPEGHSSYPDHYMVWVWIGVMAILTPLGMLLFGRLFRRAERDSAAEGQPSAEPLPAQAAADG